MKGYKLAVYAYATLAIVAIREIFSLELFPVICIFALGMSTQAVFMLCDYRLTKRD